MSEPAGSVLDHATRVLESYINYEQTMRTVTQLTDLESDLGTLVGSLREIVTGFTVLDQVSRPAARPQARATTEAWHTAAAELRATHSLPSDRQLPLKAVRQIDRGAREDVLNLWRSYVHSQMPGLDGLIDLAGILSQVEANPREVTSLRSGVADMEKLARHMPDAHAAGRVADTVTQIRSALAALVGDSEEVRQFIDDAAGRGAPVRALTPAVLEWMHTGGITKSFKIVTGRPGHDLQPAQPARSSPGADARRTTRGRPVVLGRRRRELHPR
jgi:hypothetical protein